MVFATTELAGYLVLMGGAWETWVDVQQNLDDAKSELDKAIADGDKALDDKIKALNDALDAAKAALQAEDTANKTALEGQISAAQSTLQAAIDQAQKNLNDSAFVKTPLEKIGRTDGSGHFVIKGVAPGKYRIYALNDAESDYEFHQKSEDIAFTKDIIIPSCTPATREDTTWIDSVRIDTIKTVNYTRFMPDDIVLRSFKEVQTVHHLLKSERKSPYSIRGTCAPVPAIHPHKHKQAP